MIFGRKSAARERMAEEVRRLGWWYQHFELPGGVWTGDGRPPAYRPETRWRLFEPWVPDDLAGKTVLDVGGNAGYFSVQMMKRGARRCVLVEPFDWVASQARYVARAFDYPIEVINGDVHTYVLTHDDRFDYVLFLGLFYHLKYPGLVLDRLAEMTRCRMYFQSHVVGDASLTHDTRPDYAVGADDAIINASDFPRLAFIEQLYNNDPTNWWIPNAAALEPLLRSAGMKTIARPHPQILVAEPDRPLGKVVYDKLVFPRYGKTADTSLPSADSRP
jgi:tRNA (mo5U34)-methyltransferase